MGSHHRQYRGFPCESRLNLCRNNSSESDGHGFLICSTFEHGRVLNNRVMGDRRGKPVVEFWGGARPGQDNLTTGTVVAGNVIEARAGARHLAMAFPPALAGVTLDRNRWLGGTTRTKIRMDPASSGNLW